MLGEHQGKHGGEGARDDEAADQVEAGDGGLEEGGEGLEGGEGVRGAGAGSEQQEVLHQCAGDEVEATAGLFKDPSIGG